MKFSRSVGQRRRGSVAPLVAVSLVFLVGMVAFAIDVGRITMVNAELQSAADAAALAGADQLRDGYVQYNSCSGMVQAGTVTTCEGNARVKAELYASYNRNFDNATLTLPDSGVTFGYTDNNNNYYPLADGATYTNSLGAQFPNTCQVIMNRQSGENGVLPLMFGGIFGQASANVQVRARAVIIAAQVKVVPPPYGFFPIAMDYNTWNKYIATLDASNTDQTYITNNKLHAAMSNELGLGAASIVSQYNQYDISTQNNSAGFPMLQAYPNPSGAPGNFGWLDLNNQNYSNQNVNSADDIKNWINKGIGSYLDPTSDAYSLMQPFTLAGQTEVLFPIKASDQPTDASGNPTGNVHNQTMFDWPAIPGMSATDIQALIPAIGANVWMPLFSPATLPNSSDGYASALNDPGQFIPGTSTTVNLSKPSGNNVYLNVVDYVSVTITAVDAKGGNKSIMIQPGPASGIGGTYVNPQPAGGTKYRPNFQTWARLN
jgi:Flp pilus assembly protein TadG